MTQTRFYFSAARAEAERAFALIEAAFEDEYWPVAIQEIDEDRDIHEVSVYAEPDDADEAGRRLILGKTLSSRRTSENCKRHRHTGQVS